MFLLFFFSSGQAQMKTHFVLGQSCPSETLPLSRFDHHVARPGLNSGASYFQVLRNLFRSYLAFICWRRIVLIISFWLEALEGYSTKQFMNCGSLAQCQSSLSFPDPPLQFRAAVRVCLPFMSALPLEAKAVKPLSVPSVSLDYLFLWNLLHNFGS